MSFWRTFYHLVWATHDPRPIIMPSIEEELFRYLDHKATEFDAPLHALNGWFDHVHIVLSIPPKFAVAEVVKHLKGASSHHLNHTLGLAEPFAWQRGYGVLTLGEKQLETAVNNVLRQKEPHQRNTTNVWLERTEEEDDPLGSKGVTHVTREAGPHYQAIRAETPF